MRVNLENRYISWAFCGFGFGWFGWLGGFCVQRMDVCENGTVLRLRTGDGDAVLRSPGVVGCVENTRKRRERGSFESERGELVVTKGCRRVWKLAKRVKREGSLGESCVHGRIVEAVLRSGVAEDGAQTYRIDAEVESWEGKPQKGFASPVKPWRFMYFERGDWVEYPEGANSVAWERFRAGEMMAEVVVESRVYSLSFAEMTQVNLATGYVRSIAWIGDGWEVSLPANPIAGPGGNVKDVGSRVNRHRTTSWRDGATDSISSFMLGSDGAQSCEFERNEGGNTEHESVCMNASGDYELTKLTLGSNVKTEQADAKPAVFGFEEKPTNLGNSPGFSSTLGQRFVKLDDGEKEFDDVKRKFLSGFGNPADETMITGIHRDSSPVAMARQEAFERQKVLTEQARGNANVRYGWHGTSKKGVVGIFLHGFGQPKTPKNGSAYGVGVYLALENQAFVSALYADNDENGEQHVVLCQVIAGASELVKPPSEQFHPSSEHYDTGVDDLIAPKRLIVWSTHMNTHILPLYVVSFKSPPRWHRKMAEMNGKQRSSSMFCHNVSVKHPFFTKQACGMAEALRHKACGMAEALRHKTCGMAEALRNKPIGCTNHQQGPTSAFIRFPQLFALLQRLLSPEQCLALKNCYTKYEAGSMSRRTLVQEIQKMVGRDCLIHAIQMCQGFQGCQATSVIKAQ